MSSSRWSMYGFLCRRIIALRDVKGRSRCEWRGGAPAENEHHSYGIMEFRSRGALRDRYEVVEGRESE